MAPDGSHCSTIDVQGARMARWLDGEPDAYLDSLAAEIAADASAFEPVGEAERERILQCMSAVSKH